MQNYCELMLRRRCCCSAETNEAVHAETFCRDSFSLLCKISARFAVILNNFLPWRLK